MMDIEAPGFDVLTSDASQAAKVTEWSCRVPLCFTVCAEESELANHYGTVHSSSLDLSVPPTVILPTDIQPDSDTDSHSSASDGAEQQQGSVDVNRWPGIPCPFAGCGLRIASYPGLVMHHKRAHGTPLPAKQRRAIATVYRARRLDADRASNMLDADRLSSMSAATATSVPHTASSAVVSDSFVCPFSSCGVSFASRDALVGHVQLSHEVANIIQPVCKQETDDSASAPK